METVTIEVAGQDQVFMLSDVVNIMAKKGNGKRYGKICAGTCVGVNLLVMVLSSNTTTTDAYGNKVEPDPESYLLGIALWGGISYGIGYIAGQLPDDWQVVYFNKG